MPIINRSILVPYTPIQMYDLVDAIELYPEFLPWCSSSNILSRDDDEVRATLELSGAGMSKSFTTLNRLQKGKMIEIRLVDGPFKHLEGFWRFESIDDTKCKVSLDLEFEFAGGLVDLVFGPMFHQVTSTLIDSFHDRAKVVYGEKAE